MKEYNKVYVEITNICNMNCSFCHGHKRPPKKMSLAEFNHILNNLNGLTKYVYYHLMGEPLTHPNLPDFLNLAKSKDFKSIITTNGTLLKTCGDKLLNAGVHKVNVSLHSFETGTTAKHKSYLDSVIEFAKSASSKGTIVVLRLWNSGVDGGNNQTVIKHLKTIFTNEWKQHPHGMTIDKNIYLEWGERFEWPDENQQIKGDKFYCYGLKDQFGILVDGTVVPCCLDSNGVINLGNVFKSDLTTILSTERANLLVNGFKCGKASEDLCKKCGYAQRFIKK